MNTRAVPARVVGDWVLKKRLGEGGMGVVYLAQHRRSGVMAAVKLLRPQAVGDREGRNRLAREVASLERVRGAWIAEILDADPQADVPYLVTRYVNGPSLDDVVAKRGPLRGEALWHLAHGLAEGILSCHEVGVLHRDVKPTNVLMDGSQPVLIDFGLARAEGDTRITQTGFLMGTPGYLPPELVEGAPFDQASDVFSWGATVAYGGTGRAPFGKGTHPAVMERARRGDADLEGVEEPLRAVLKSALSPDPTLRPSFDALVDWFTVPGAPPPVPGRVRALAGGPPPTALLSRSQALTQVALPEDDYDDEPDDYEAEGLEWCRRFVTALAALALMVAAVSAFPLIAAGVLTVVSWFVAAGRRGHLSVAGKRSLRGARWHDGPAAIASTPWYLVATLPQTLLRAAWSFAAGGLVAAIGHLLSRRWDSADQGGVILGAAVAVLLLTIGPGTALVRYPLGSGVVGISRLWRPWLVLVLLLAAAAFYALWHLQTYGAQWWPLRDSPLSGLGE